MAIKLVLLLMFSPTPASAQEVRPETCSYEVYNWNIHKKRAVNFGIPN